MTTDNTDDLSQLEQLDNTITLKVLKSRYEKDLIYTNCGDILIALNPCKELPIFGEEQHNKYDWQNFSEIPAPHVFHTAARAFRRMRESKTDQVIIVTGESGAGKTESTKFMVKHFVHMCQSDNKELHEKIIKVNPLLEAFGNAKTHMNHNSSRFAKYLELSFSETWDLNGGKPIGRVSFRDQMIPQHSLALWKIRKEICAKLFIIRDYMLEKSRVVHRSNKEGNFHAFYSLLHGAPKETLKALSLEKPINSYRIMQSDPDSLIAEARYKEMYKQQNKVLQQIETNPHVVDSLLAAVIHLTEITFVESSAVAGASELSDLAPAVYASELLSVKVEDLIEALVSSKMAIRGDEVRRNKGPQQAAEGRDALAKMLYERTFQWLVRQINLDLHPNRRGFGQTLSTSILDIAGFEKLPVNSLEQLCINIVNERLQNFMNERLFRFELQAYSDEGIDIVDVEFENNDVLISFLTKPRNSVLAILDEQSNLQHGSDIAFVRQLTELYKDSSIYIPPVTNRPEFTVRHFAGKVTYDAACFLEKNRDLLNPELKECMKSSQDHFISDLFTVKRGPTGTISSTVHNYGKSRRETGVPTLPAGASKREQQLADLRKSLAAFFKRKEQATTGVIGLQQITTNKQHKTIVSHFRASLLQLLDRISRAEHFFVRCLKPNEDLKQNDFTDDVVTEQLKYNGISQMAKIRKMGFTYRRTHAEFVLRYSYAWTDTFKVQKNRYKLPITRLLRLGSYRNNKRKERSQQGTVMFGSDTFNRIIDFRYSDVLPDTIQVQENRYSEAAINLLKSEVIPSGLQKDFRLGKTKVFMKERLVSWLEGVLYEVHKKKEEEKRREEERKRKEEEERKKREEEERKRKEEEERKRKEEEERKRKEEEERKRKEEVRKKKEEEECKRREEDERKIKEKEEADKTQEIKKGIIQSTLKHKKTSVWQSLRFSSSKSNAVEDHEAIVEHQSIQIPKNWKIGELIGSGGFGIVYQVLDAGTQEEQFAVKQIAFCRSKQITKVIGTLKTDIKIFESLQHERIAKYYGWADENCVFSIFLEYAQNRSVDNYLKSKGVLDDSNALGLVRQVLEGLAFLHARGIVHGDLKASNILLDKDMNTKLCDIGLSTTLEAHTFASRGCTTSVGSSFWSSPEVVKGEQSNVKMDIWSLGCTSIELLTAHRPWYPHPPYTALLRIGCGLSPLGDAHEQFSISDVMKEFLDPMFHVDATKRPSAQDLLSHSVYSK